MMRRRTFDGEDAAVGEEHDGCQIPIEPRGSKKQAPAFRSAFGALERASRAWWTLYRPPQRGDTEGQRPNPSVWTLLSHSFDRANEIHDCADETAPRGGGQRLPQR